MLATSPRIKMGRRLITDLDLMVSPDEVEPALDCLRNLGYRIHSKTPDGTAKWYADLARPDHVGMIDLHQCPPGHRFFYSAADSVRQHCRLQGAAYVPSPTYHALMLIIHDQFQDCGLLGRQDRPAPSARFARSGKLARRHRLEFPGLACFGQARQKCDRNAARNAKLAARRQRAGQHARASDAAPAILAPQASGTPAGVALCAVLADAVRLRELSQPGWDWKSERRDGLRRGSGFYPG